MMPDDPLVEAALDVTDGRPVDWDRCASTVGRSDTGPWLHLRTLEQLAHVQHWEERASPPDPPFRWGRLEVLRRIGQGSFGDVYAARDPGLDRPVALKLSSAVLDDAALDERVVQEGSLLARVRHPNVVTVHGAERIGGRSGVWMEFVEGETLENELRRRGPLPADALLRIGLDLSGALEAVHAAGLLHRDVKAQNVMRDRTGRVVLMDFGAGHDASDAAAYERLTGTPAYLAPELLAGARPSPATDMYALGVLLFRLASGHFPVSGTTVQQLREGHRRSRPASMRRYRPDLPGWMVAVIDRAIQPDPAARFATAAALQQALREGSASALPPAARRLVTPFAALALVTLAGVWITYSAGEATRKVTPGTTPQLETVWANPAVYGIQLGSVSDDGRFASALAEGRSIVLHDLETGLTRSIAGGDASQGPEYSAVSSDGGRVAITWGRSGVYDLRVVDRLVPSSPRVVVPADPAMFDYVVPFDWSTDGTKILAGFRKDRRFDIAIVDVARGSLQVIRRAFWTPSVRAVFSRDGRRVALSVPEHALATQLDLFVVDSAAGPDDRPLVRLEGSADEIVAGWSPDGRRLLFVSDRVGSAGLWSLPMDADRTSDQPELLRPDLAGLPLRVTSSGDLFLATPISDRALYLATVDFGTGRVVSSPKRAIARQDSSITGPVFSPDGGQLAFTVRRAGDSGGLELTVVSTESGHTRSVPLPVHAFLHLAWAPDGSSVLGTANRGSGASGVHEVKLATGEVVLLKAGADSPQLGPENKLYFRRPLGSPPFEYVERALASGEERVIFRYDAPLSVALSPDGQQVAAVLSQGAESGPRVRRLVLWSVDGRDTREIYRSAQMTFLALWTPDGRSILICDNGRLGVVPVVGGDPRWLELRVAPPPQRNEHVALHPDGQQVAFLAGQSRVELWRLQHYLLSR